MNRSFSRRRMVSAALAVSLAVLSACRNIGEGLPWKLDDKPSARAATTSLGGENDADKADKPKSIDANASSESKPKVDAQTASAGKENPARSDVNGAGADAPVVDENILALLGKDGWRLNVTPPGARADNPGLRWQNPLLVEFLRTPAAERPNLTPLVDSKNAIVAANAAIVQARWRQAAPVERLDATVRNSGLPMPLRLASVEALRLIDSPAANEAIERLLAKFGDASGPSATDRQTKLPRLQADLLLAIAPAKPAGHSPCWLAALQSSDVEVQLIALAAWAQTDVELPDSAVVMCENSDARIRAAALDMLAKRRHPRALAHLTRCLDDYDLSVRLAAIAGLGVIGGPEARLALEKTMRQPGEVVRAAAVSALAALGADEAIVVAATDKSWRVRLAVAESLADPQGMANRLPREAARTVSAMIADHSPHVQRAAVVATAGWPLELAGPLLLEAMHEKGYLVRKTSANQLAQRWPPAAEFPVDSTPDTRTLALETLQRKWIAEFSAARAPQLRAPNEAPRYTLDRIATEWRELVAREKFSGGLSHQAWVRSTLEKQKVAQSQQNSQPPVDVAEVRALVLALSKGPAGSEERQRAIEALKKLGPAALAAYEEIALGDQQPLPEEIYFEVLPASQPAFAILLELKNSKPTERWSLMERLAAYMANQPLSPLALSRLADLMTEEKEPLVWQSALAALINDDREPAARLAAMAVGNPTAEVRRRACEYLARHGDPKHEALLRPLLEDSQLTVLLVAIRALEAGGAIEDPAPLVHLLLRPEKNVRLAAATALCRLRVKEGPPALERLVADADPDVRRGAASAMGELGDRQFAPLLIELLGDRNDVAQMSQASLMKLAGKDVSFDAKDDVPPNASEKIRRWRRWFEADQRDQREADRAVMDMLRDRG